jgi:LPS export ABC transporter protein LptC
MKLLPYVLNNAFSALIRYKTFIWLITLAAGGCVTEDREKFTAYDYMLDKPVEVTHNAEVWYSDSAKIKAHLVTPLIERFRADRNKFEFSEGIHLRFFDPYPNQSALVTSRYGVRYPEEKITELMYDVFVVNESGDTLETEHLIWEEDKDRVYSEKLVKVTTPDETIIAEGFESDPSFREYTFYHIKGTLKSVDP